MPHRDNSSEYKSFTDGLKKILQANPKIVKAAMEEEKRERAQKRKEKYDDLANENE